MPTHDAAAAGDVYRSADCGARQTGMGEGASCSGHTESGSSHSACKTECNLSSADRLCTVLPIAVACCLSPKRNVRVQFQVQLGREICVAAILCECNISGDA